MATRPAQGQNSIAKRPARPAYVASPAPKVVGRGSLSRPIPLGKWSPSTQPKDAPGKIVQR